MSARFGGVDIAKGDRVRCVNSDGSVIFGTVTVEPQYDVDLGHWLYVQASWREPERILISRGHGWTAEVLAPPPDPRDEIEPPPGTVVLDIEGIAWQRRLVGWHPAVPEGLPLTSFDELQADYAPLTILAPEWQQ